jgi:hypothetical protein
MSNYQQFRILKSNACSLVGRPQKGMRKPKVPLTFERWFLNGIRKMEKRGAEFTFLYPGMVRIEWPGKPAVLRTVNNFKEEYETEYLFKFFI